MEAISTHIKNNLGDDPTKCILNTTCINMFAPSSGIARLLFLNVTQCFGDCFKNSPNQGQGDACDEECQAAKEACLKDTGCATAFEKLADHIKINLDDNPEKCLLDASCVALFAPASGLSRDLYVNLTACFSTCFDDDNGGSDVCDSKCGDRKKACENNTDCDASLLAISAHIENTLEGKAGICLNNNTCVESFEPSTVIGRTLYYAMVECYRACFQSGQNDDACDAVCKAPAEVCDDNSICFTAMEKFTSYVETNLTNDRMKCNQTCVDKFAPLTGIARDLFKNATSCFMNCVNKLGDAVHVEGWTQSDVHDPIEVDVGTTVVFHFTEDGAVISLDGGCSGIQVNSGPLKQGDVYTMVVRAQGSFQFVSSASSKKALITVKVNEVDACPADMLAVGQCQQDRLNWNQECGALSNDKAGCQAKKCVFEDYSWCYAIPGGDNSKCRGFLNGTSCQATSGCLWKQSTQCSFNCTSLSHQSCDGVQGCRWYGCVMSNCSQINGGWDPVTCGDQYVQRCNSQLLSYGCHWHDSNASPQNMCAKDHWRPDDHGDGGGSGLCDSICKDYMTACKNSTSCSVAAEAISNHIKTVLGGNIFLCNDTCFQAFKPKDAVGAALYEKLYKCYVGCFGNPPDNGDCDYSKKCPRLFSFCNSNSECKNYVYCVGNCRKNASAYDDCFKQCRSSASDAALDIADAFFSCGSFKCREGRCSVVNKAQFDISQSSTVEIDFLVPLEDVSNAALTSIFGLTMIDGKHPHFTSVKFINGKLGVTKNGAFVSLPAPSGRYYISHVYNNGSLVGDINREVWIDSDGLVYVCDGSNNNNDDNDDGGGCPFTDVKLCTDLSYLCDDKSPQHNFEMCCSKIRAFCDEHPTDTGCDNDMLKPCFEESNCPFQNPIICGIVSEPCSDETDSKCCDAMKEVCAKYDDPYCKSEELRSCINSDYCDEVCDAKMDACTANSACKASADAISAHIKDNLKDNFLACDLACINSFKPANVQAAALFTAVLGCYMDCFGLTPQLECKGETVCPDLYKMCVNNPLCLKTMTCQQDCYKYSSGVIVKQCVDKCSQDTSISSTAKDLFSSYTRCVNFRCHEGDCRTIVEVKLMTTDESTYIDGDFFVPMSNFNITQMRKAFNDSGLVDYAHPHKKFRYVSSQLQFVFGTTSYFRVPDNSGPYYLGNIVSVINGAKTGAINQIVWVVDGKLMTCNKGCPFSNQTTCDTLGQSCSESDLYQISPTCCAAIRQACLADPTDIGCQADIVIPCIRECPFKNGPKCSALYDYCDDFNDSSYSEDCCEEIFDHCSANIIDSGCKTTRAKCSAYEPNSPVFDDGDTCPFAVCDAPYSPNNALPCQNSLDATFLSACCNYTRLYCQRTNDTGCYTDDVSDAFNGDCDFTPPKKEDLVKIINKLEIEGITQVTTGAKAALLKALAILLNLAEEYIEILSVSVGARRVGSVSIEYQVTTSSENTAFVTQQSVEIVDSGDLLTELQTQSSDFSSASGVTGDAPVVSDASTSSSASALLVSTVALLLSFAAAMFIM